jgi:hypothetical protein
VAKESDAGAKEKVDPLFTGGMDPNEASDVLSGLLSEDQLDGTIKSFTQEDEEEGEPGSEDTHLSEEDESEQEEEDFEESDSDDDSLEEEWDEDEDYDEDNEEPEDLYTVKVDGEDQEVTLDELLSGYSYQAHNTRTAQQLSEDRKALLEESAAVSQSRDQYAQRLEQVEKALAESAPQEPDWEVLKREDPQEFAVQFANWQQHRQNLAAVEAERERVEGERTEDFQKQLNAYRASEGSKLIEAMPAWKDPEKLKSSAEEIRAFALSRGFTDAELENVVDHRAVLMMRDAMLYQKTRKGGKRQMEARKQKGGQKGKPLTPGARRPRGKKPSRKVQAARRQVRAGGRMSDATEFLKHALPDDVL